MMISYKTINRILFDQIRTRDFSVTVEAYTTSLLHLRYYLRYNKNIP